MPTVELLAQVGDVTSEHSENEILFIGVIELYRGGG